MDASNVIIVIVMALMALLLSALALGLVRVRLWIALSSTEKRVKVMFGRITVLDTLRRAPRTRVRTHSRPHQEPEEKLEQKEAPPFSRRWRGIRRTIEIVPALVKATLVYLVRVISKTRLRNVRCAISGGLADPADTGMIFGALYALAGAVPWLGAKMKMEPDYLGERMEYDLRGEIALRPISLLVPTVKLVGDLPKRELFRLVRERRKHKRAG